MNTSQISPFHAGEIIIYDTEYTAWEGSLERNWSGENEYKELIQISAIRVNSTINFEEMHVLDLYVRPLRNPILSPYISHLTDITQNDINEKGLHPANALREFGSFCGQTRAWSYGRDDLILNDNRRLTELSPSPHSGGFGDLRPIFAGLGIDVNTYSSGTLHTAVGADLQGHTHNALFDVRSIISALKHFNTK
jgi:inhibitor of KinA sporulation pathway (predicted exonuclease)